ncbi:hypothetical protein [Paludibacterium yongneupense]|uniref:hypothetical protein n=1 Tax=Paludibacterium yongneupense TaxID=400061 RepID=UPI00055FEE67|nr:hypothetical protein [Paludibacterium yongneupense]
MEINSTSPTAGSPLQNATAARTTPATVPPAPPITGAAASSVVSLSDAGKAAAKADSTDTGTDGDKSPSGVKAFAYGTLGLGQPKSEDEAKAEPPADEHTESYYTAGRLLAAAVTVGTLISMVA